MTIAGALYATINGPSWDDLRAPASAIPLRGQSGDPGTDTDGTLLFDNTSVEQIAVIYQMPHSWDHGSDCRFHIHWAKTTDAAGDVEWEMRYRLFNNNATVPDWSAWAAATSRSKTIAADQSVLIDAWEMLDMTGLIGSSMVSIQLRRNPAASDDTYAADARLWEADIHYQAYGIGSELEYPTA